MKTVAHLLRGAPLERRGPHEHEDVQRGLVRGVDEPEGEERARVADGAPRGEERRAW